MIIIHFDFHSFYSWGFGVLGFWCRHRKPQQPSHGAVDLQLRIAELQSSPDPMVATKKVEEEYWKWKKDGGNR